MIAILSAWGVARGDRQECQSTNKLMALLTTTESKVQDVVKKVAVIHRGEQYNNDKVFSFVSRCGPL